MRMSWISSRWRTGSVALIVIATALVYWPGVRSFFVIDDFFLIAISRMVGEPFSAFVHNHFPGGLFYRPLTMAFWWLSVELFGSAPRPHYLLNLALHIGVSLALWHLLCAWTQARVASMFAALAFAVHPIAVGTALWLSDRFDLLAALFSLLAINAAWRYRMTANGHALFATFLLIVLATLSKETGFVVFAPVLAVWVWPHAQSTSFWTPPRRAACALALLAIALLAWRAYIFSDLLDHILLSRTPASRLFGEGAWRWSEKFFLYLMQLPRMGTFGQIATVLGMLSLALGMFIGAARVGISVWRSELGLLAASALALILTTSLVQAPILRNTPISLDAQSAAVSISSNSRFFYLSLVGLMMLACALYAIAKSVWRNSRVRNVLAIAAIAMCLVPLASVAHRLAHNYRQQSLVQAHLMQAAVDSLTHETLPADQCQVYLLGVGGDQEFTFAMTVDAAIKTLSMDLTRVQGCRFQTETAPWFYVLKRDSVTPDSVAPMQVLQFEGKPVPWPEYGGVEVAYLNLLDGTEARSLTSAIFLAYERGKFVDVTSEVLAGERNVKFRTSRKPQ